MIMKILTAMSAIVLSLPIDWLSPDEHIEWADE